MKQSNTSHNKIDFYGILQPITDLLEKTSRQSGKLSGQDIVMMRKNVKAIIALDGEKNIHLLIDPAPADDSRLSKLEMKGLKISVNQWAVAQRPSQDYLDISCATGTLPSFKRPFLRFAEDVLLEISQSEISPEDAVYRTGMRWKKFWSPDAETEVTREWLYGIFGELLFLKDLIERFGPEVINSWAGPGGKDHDFQTGIELAIEVKTSVEVPFQIRCNTRQLDHTLFKSLYLVCYKITSSETGIDLSSLVRNIENLINKDEGSLEKFYENLMLVGYRRHMESVYSAIRINPSEAVVLQINEVFPKIVEGSFKEPLDQRISDIRYKLRLTNLPEQSITDISGKLKLFAKSK